MTTSRKRRKAQRKPPIRREPGNMTTGMDPLVQGLDRKSGTLPIGSKGVGGTKNLYYTDFAERCAGLAGLLYPPIDKLGRGDMSPEAAKNRSATSPLGPKVEIAYTWDGRARTYLPDFVGQTADGRTVIIEAGVSHQKGRPQELAKLAAAKAYTDLSGGETLVVAVDRIKPRWVRGALRWHLARFDYRGDPELPEAIGRIWATEKVSIADLVERLKAEHEHSQIIAAAGKVIGDLLAKGRLDVDLAETVIAMGTPIRRRPDHLPPLEPPGIIRDLDQLRALAAAHKDGSGRDLEEPADRPDVDEDAIVDPRTRQEFLARRAAVGEKLATGISAAEAAHRHGIDVRRFQQLWNAYQKEGEAALLRYASRTSSGRGVPREMVRKIAELHSGTDRPSVQAIVDNEDIHLLAQTLGMKRSPTWYQINRIVLELESTDETVRLARAGRKLEPLTVTGSAVTTEQVPGFVCEFDEHVMDVKVQALGGSETTLRLHIGLLIDVATRYPLSVVMAPKALDQWDVRRAVLRAMLPDAELRDRFGITGESPWA